MRRFFYNKQESQAQKTIISGSDANHIRNVLRLKPGDTIGLFDGTGLEFEAEIIAFSAGKVEVSIIQVPSSCTESPVEIAVAQAFLKEKKMDSLVRPLTELGITSWIPFFSERSVAKPETKRLAARKERWEKIAKEALKQCRRGHLIQIRLPVSFAEVLCMGRPYDLKIVFWENETAPVRSACYSPGTAPEKIFVMIGPEGGFTQQEIEFAIDAGFTIASLGPRVLRAETATIAGCSLLQYLFGDMGQKNLDNKTAF